MLRADEANKQTVYVLAKRGYSPEQIAKMTGLSKKLVRDAIDLLKREKRL